MQFYIQPNRGEKYNKIWGRFFIISVVIMILAGVYLDHKGKIKDFAYEFDGKVDKVTYDVKGKASVTIKGIQYDLSDPNWDFDHNRIQTGDSMIKKKNSMIIRLIKRDGKTIIEDSK